MPEIIHKREKNYTILSQIIYNNPKYYRIESSHLNVVSNFAFPIICKTKSIRDELVKKCENLVEIRPIVGGDISSQPFFKKYMKRFLFSKSNSKLVHEQGLYFGNNPELTASEIRQLLSIFK